MEPKDQILGRMYVVLTLLGIVPVLVAGQMFYVVLVEGPGLRAEGERQANATITLPAMRGAILDRAGRTLAVNTARYDVALDPKAPGFEAAAEDIYRSMARITGQSARSLRSKVTRRRSPQYVLLLRGIDERQKEALDTTDIPGLILHPRFARRYNYGNTAAHLLGHVDADGMGLAGLEKQYNDHLLGTPGRRAVQRDRRGVLKAAADGQVVPPHHGESLVLTVDLVRQTVLEEELARGVAESGAKWGTAIAMNPHTGAILALANVPTYDPNRAAAFTNDARRNRAITDRIEPGSTFKLITAVAAVEQGIVALEDSIETGNGWMVIHGRTLRDSHGYGTITFADVLALSSNVGTAKVAMKMEQGVFYQYARNLGFGQNTWVDLPGEIAGRLKKPAEWSGTTLNAMSRGYEVEVTPLQILTAYSALANGGLLVQPYVIDRRTDPTGKTVWYARQDSVRRAFKSKTARALLPAFERVVSEGTAKRAQIDGLRIAGKTGTAIKVSGGKYDRSAYRASFVGFFPADDPQVALIVVLDEPRTSIYGGVVAAPIFQRTAQRWLGTLPGIEREALPTDEAAPPLPAPTVPDVTGQPAAVAAARLLAAGYELDAPDAAEAARTVVRQRPAPGVAAHLGARVRLTLADAADLDATLPNTPPNTMPDLTGLSLREATFWLAAHNVDVQVEGHGIVTGQTPQAGSALPERAVLRCRSRL